MSTMFAAYWAGRVPDLVVVDDLLLCTRVHTGVAVCRCSLGYRVPVADSFFVVSLTRAPMAWSTPPTHRVMTADRDAAWLAWYCPFSSRKLCPTMEICAAGCERRWREQNGC